MLSPAKKDILSALQKSYVIYEFKCHCNSWHAGRTFQQLQYRINQHVPKWLIQNHTIVLNNTNLIGCARRNKPLQNGTQSLVNTLSKVANSLPDAMNINAPSWIWHAVGFISVCEKLPISKYPTHLC